LTQFEAGGGAAATALVPCNYPKGDPNSLSKLLSFGSASTNHLIIDNPSA